MLDISPVLPSMIGAAIGGALASFYFTSSGSGIKKERTTDQGDDHDPPKSYTNG